MPLAGNDVPARVMTIARRASIMTIARPCLFLLASHQYQPQGITPGNKMLEHYTQGIICTSRKDDTFCRLSACFFFRLV